MNNKRVHIIYLAIVSVLVIMLGLVLRRPEKVIVETKYLTDTTTVTNIDTVEVIRVIEVEKTVTDTAYITVRDSIFVPVPISTYRFSEEGLYDITAHGFNVSLSNVTVYPKTVYRTVTNTVEKQVLARKWEIYGGFGLWRFRQEWMPNIGLAIKTPKNLLFTANLGYYDRSLLFGGTVYYNLKKQR